LLKSNLQLRVFSKIKLENNKLLLNKIYNLNNIDSENEICEKNALLEKIIGS